MGVFKFKQFEVDQTGCAMKINTDGVLIAALANHLAPKKILDIGTGTGVIALMLAQRFQQADIHAVEIDGQAAVAAARNFQASIFSHRLKIHHTSIESYSKDDKFDLIVSNPPFFVNDLKNKEERKGIARHANEDFFEGLIQKASFLLSNYGAVWLILPIKQAIEVVACASNYGLSLNHRINIYSDKNKSSFRQIICLAKEDKALVETDFFIYESLGNHTLEYKQLLKDFFLAF